ncbi:MAG: carboxypeptidase regulatory-like domain-containing protein [Candidatus Binatia bacterium]|nr:carboxypeptidase regulatory-like domain-containing protein [Candidatus Binatia bacterium]
MNGKSYWRIGALAILAAAVAMPSVASAEGTVSGKVAFDGTAPKRKKLRMDADPVCAASHDEPVLAEEVVVGDDGGLQNVFIFVKEGLPEKDYPAPSDPVVIDQNGCHYEPHVIGVQVGQPLQILNSDKTLHNVHGMPKTNAGFNFAMPKFVKKKDHQFDSVETMVAVKCDVHPWMSSYIGVLPHPFFAVTGPDGTFEIDGLPAGDYTIEAWQEKLGTQEAKVNVAADGTTTVDFTFKES